MNRLEIENEYILDVTELLDEAETALLRLLEKEDIHENWKVILRVLHSIKGSAGMFGFKELEAHIHKTEDFCVQFQHDVHLEILEEVSTYILTSIDKTRLYLTSESSYKFEDIVYYQSIEDYLNQFKTKSLPKDIDSDDKSLKESHKNVLKDSKYSILAIDDDKQLLSFYDMYLCDMNVSIEKESSPFVALEKINKRPPDILLLDYKMPELSGLELYQRVKDSGLNIPTIFVTGVDDPSLYEDLSNNGAFAIVPKPIHKSMLIYTINQVIKIVDKQKALKRSLKLVRTYFDCLKEHYKSNDKEHRIDNLKNEIIDLYKYV